MLVKIEKEFNSRLFSIIKVVGKCSANPAELHMGGRKHDGKKRHCDFYQIS